MLTRIRQLQAMTIVWMCVEAGPSLWSAWKAHSPSLLGFGGNSVMELLSATVVLWRFRHPASEKAETCATLIVGSLLIVLALAVLVVSIRALAGYREPTPEPSGHCRADRGRPDHAVSRPREAPPLRPDWQRGFESRCCGIDDLLLSFSGRFSRTGSPEALERGMGGSGSRYFANSADRARGGRSPSRPAVLLIWNGLSERDRSTAASKTHSPDPRAGRVSPRPETRLNAHIAGSRAAGRGASGAAFRDTRCTPARSAASADGRKSG